MIVAGDDCKKIDKIKMIFIVEFELKDLEKLKYLLGIERVHPTRLILNQRKYNLVLLKKTKKLCCRLVSTPIEAN